MEDAYRVPVGDVSFSWPSGSTRDVYASPSRVAIAGLFRERNLRPSSR